MSKPAAIGTVIMPIRVPRTLGFGDSIVQITGVRATNDPEKNPYKTQKAMTLAFVVTAIQAKPITLAIMEVAMIVFHEPTLSAKMLGSCAMSVGRHYSDVTGRTNLPNADPVFMSTIRYLFRNKSSCSMILVRTEKTSM